MKVLLTAEPGAGKTTVLTKFMELYPGNMHGIISQEIRDGEGNRIGFKAVDLDGNERVFMHKTAIDSDIMIANKYHVDLSAIDEFMVPQLLAGINDPGGVILIDEIGRAEVASELFLQTIRQLFSSDVNFLGIIVYDPEPWSLEFKDNPEVTILVVTAENRDQLPEQLVEIFSK